MPNDILNVVCVFWRGAFRGRDYSLEDVVRLEKMVARWLKHRPYQLWCLTNDPEVAGVLQDGKVIPLKYDLPGWWSKLELFRADLPLKGKCMYLDLDVIICGGLDDIAFRREGLTFMPQMKPTFGTTAGRKKRKGKDKGKLVISRFQSSVFTWTAGSWFFDSEWFGDKENLQHIMNTYRGDQDFFGAHFQDNGGHFPARWFEKIRFCYQKGPGKDVRVVLGNPKGLYRNALKSPPKWMRDLI